jgi:hypothetical protein
MRIVKKTSEYHISLDEMKALFAKELKVDVSRVSVSYNLKNISDDDDDRYPVQYVESIKVTVNDLEG